MPRVVVLAALTLAMIASLRWNGRAQQPPGGVPNPLFTGTTTPMDGKDLSVARRRFEPGARTYWHSHDRGQLLMVEEGRMRLQKRGEPVREFGAGASDYTAPNVVHWHGAAPDQPVVQLNVGFGGDAKWFGEVTAAEYAATPRN